MKSKDLFCSGRCALRGVLCKPLQLLSCIAHNFVEHETQGEKKAAFNIGSTEVILRLMEGEYIKYRDIIPKDNPVSVKIGKEILQIPSQVSILY